jgi:serine/threonine-protein kinase HipA
VTDESEPLGVLAIHLGDDLVGELRLLPNDMTEFALSERFRELPRRPVLGQVFEDDLMAVHRARMRLPPFFSNLLPEGRLRELVAARLDVAPEREFFLLARLGEDLPGAVRATVVVAPPEQVGSPGLQRSAQLQDSPLKFSLAGVQPKLSMIREGRGMTLPASGHGGDWIVKLPGNRYQGVPENEFATMTWAKRIGLEVPSIELVPMTELQGLPRGVDAGDGMAFAIRRFDRPQADQRVHIEDFAQVRDVYPDSRAKYGSTNYETIAKILLQTADDASFNEFVRRLAFIIVSANADAHIKNWSLIYRDRQRAQLSPAYDLVSTIEFIEEDSLALNLAKTKNWQHFSVERISAFAQRVGADPTSVVDLFREVVQRSLDEWPSIRRELPVSELLATRLEAHWKRVPLIGELTATR